MMVKCEECGRVLNLINAVSLALDEDGEYRGRYFCSEEHMERYAAKTGSSVRRAQNE